MCRGSLLYIQGTASPSRLGDQRCSPGGRGVHQVDLVRCSTSIAITSVSCASRSIASGNYHRLIHGHTLHGQQSLDPGRRHEPLTYYHRTGPIGQVFGVLRHGSAQSNVAIVGLGAGSLACYAEPGQHWTFYEIDPAVEKIARDPRYFTFLDGMSRRVARRGHWAMPGYG